MISAVLIAVVVVLNHFITPAYLAGEDNPPFIEEHGTFPDPVFKIPCDSDDQKLVIERDPTVPNSDSNYLFRTDGVCSNRKCHIYNVKPVDKESMKSEYIQFSYLLIDKRTGKQKKYLSDKIYVRDANDEAPYPCTDQVIQIPEEDNSSFRKSFEVEMCNRDLEVKHAVVEASPNIPDDLKDVFSVRKKPNGSFALNVMKKIDRERFPLDGIIKIPVVTRDCKDASEENTCVEKKRHLFIFVKDKNDNVMENGKKKVDVVALTGTNIPKGSNFGSIYVKDKDSLNLNKDKCFTVTSQNSPFYTTTNGSLILSSSLPASRLPEFLEVHVKDRHSLQEAIGSVEIKKITIDIKDKKDVAKIIKEQAGSCLFEGSTAEKFLQKVPSSNESYLDKFETGVTNILRKIYNFQNLRFFVFSVQEKTKTYEIVNMSDYLHRSKLKAVIEKVPSFEIWFITTDEKDRPKLSRSALNSVISMHAAQIEKTIGLDTLRIQQCPVNLCAKDQGNGCTMSTNLSMESTVLFDAGERALVGLNIWASRHYSCPFHRTPTKCGPESCSSSGSTHSICHNIGTSSEERFFCECRDPVRRGAQCEALSRKFSGNGYAMVSKGIAGSCSKFMLSFEFTSTSKNEKELLLYWGPYGRSVTDDSLEISADGEYIVATINPGNIELRATVNSSIGWHHVQFNRYLYQLELVVDNLAPSVVVDFTNTSSVQWGEVQFNFQNEEAVLVGGVPEALRKSINKNSFHGCIRNLRYNDHVFNFDEVVLSKNSSVGCQMGSGCHKTSCSKKGECTQVGTEEPVCHCDLGYTGQKCDKRVEWQSVNNYPTSVSLPDHLVNNGQMHSASFFLMKRHPGKVLNIRSQNAPAEVLVYSQKDYVSAERKFTANTEVRTGILTSVQFIETDSYKNLLRLRLNKIGGKIEPDLLFSGSYLDLGAVDLAIGSYEFEGCIAELSVNRRTIELNSTKFPTCKLPPYLTCAQLSCGSGQHCIEFWAGAVCTCSGKYILNPDQTLLRCGIVGPAEERKKTAIPLILILLLLQ